MLVIRAEQMRAFEEAARRSFENTLTRQLLPDMQPPRTFEQAAALVRAAVAEAMAVGIDDTEDAARWVRWQVLHAGDFATLRQQPAVAELLANPAVPGHSKIEYLGNCMSRESHHG